MGFLPMAPGTWGSLLGVGLFLFLTLFPLSFYAAGLAGVMIVGTWAAHEAERQFGEKDAPSIVIDEIAGMLLTYFSLPMTGLSVLSGFLLFRLFDIVKPVPKLEQLSGGWGIMLDDVCAGVLAHIGVRLLLLAF